MNTILHERQLEEYYCTLCYASFDFKRRHVTLANSGLPYPDPLHGGRLRADRAARRAAGIVSRHHLRRGDYRPRARRRLRVLLGRHLRGDERRRRRVHVVALIAVVEQTRQGRREGDRRRDLRGRRGVPRRGDPERRHDRRGDQDHRVAPRGTAKTRASPAGDRAGEDTGAPPLAAEIEQVAIGSLTNETEYGDASACLCLSHPVDPTRPAGPLFKWRAAPRRRQTAGDPRRRATSSRARVLIR